MAEFRWEPVTGTWTVLAPGRSARPIEFTSSPPLASRGGECPFCAGQEHQTPPAVLTLGDNGESIDSQPESAVQEVDAPDADAATWRVRVVPNLYPAVDDIYDGGDSPNRATHRVMDDGGSDPDNWSIPADGAHEVVIVEPRHVTSWQDAGGGAMELMFSAIHRRLCHFAGDARIKYVQVFQNSGADAGASIEHLHAQLIALPATPAIVARELQRCANWQARYDHCLLCHLASDALGELTAVLGASAAAGAPGTPDLDAFDIESTRIVAVRDRFVAYCPWASRGAAECWIQPLDHAARFELASDEAVEAAGAMLRDVLVGLERAWPGVAYNWWLHSSPFDNEPYDHYHWHIEVLPRISKAAGFEWGTGWSINSVEPIDAARLLRRCIPHTPSAARRRR